MSRRTNSRQKPVWLSIVAVCLLSLFSPFVQRTTAQVQATTVSAALPSAVAYDAAGNLYVALRNDHLVRKIDTAGFITTVAGTGEQGFSGDNGAATSALLDSPSGIAVDAAGNLYIADTRNHRIRKVVNGTITTIAGTGVRGFAGDGGAAASAQLNSPAGVSVDTAGNVYIADTDNQRIRKIISGVISTVAGTGEQGSLGDGGPATSALLDSPASVAADPASAGRFFISDTHNQKVRVVDLTGNISVIAGTGAASFGGDGGPAAAAQLDRPRGLALDASGNLYIADTDNQRVRRISSGNIATVAGDGEQTFFGDTVAPASAVLDTPQGIAVSSAGVIALADSHNQRVRSVAVSIINTVAGIPPPLTEGILLSGPTSAVFGASAGTLTATFSNAGKSATGSFALIDSGVQVATSTISGNTASFNLGRLAGGLHTLAVRYAGDTINAPSASGVYLVVVVKAQQTITFPRVATPVIYSPGLTAPLAATSDSGLTVSYTVTGPATVSGSTLTYTGAGTVVVTATQAGDSNYEAALPVSQTITVMPLLVASAVTPASAPLGSTNVSITVTGSGFTGTSVIEFNGAALPTSGNATTLTAVIPQLTTLGAQGIVVHDTVSQQRSATLTFTVAPPAASATLTGPPTVSSGQQPVVNVQVQSYPIPITGLLTLTFTPDANLGVDDPAIQFANGTRTLAFNIPANSTSVPTVTFQSGTVAGTISVTLTLTANGVDITPASARLLTFTVPRVIPSDTVTLTQSGKTLTVFVTGFSNTREVATATFTFTPAPGSKISTPVVTLPVADAFAAWFNSAASRVYGSTFLYFQTFTLSDDEQVQAVSVVLKNSVGTSIPATSP